jgi:hypothetical protein
MAGFTPSPGAVDNLGNAVTNLVFTVAGKLDDAEKASEYNNGVETLRRGLTQFDLSLDQNPDWRKYPELAAQKENELWQQVDQATKHQGAKNELQQTWQQMRDAHLGAIGNISNNVRIKMYHADLVKRIDQREKDVEAGTITAAEAASANDADLKAASDTSVIDPTAAFTTGEQSKAYMQTAEASRKIREEARANGWDAAIAKIPEIAGQYSELKSPGQVDAFTTTMERQRDYAEARQKKEDDKINGDTDIKLADMWSDFLIGEKDISLDQMKKAIDGGDFRRQEGAQLKRSWLANLESYVKQGGRGGKKSASEDSTMGKLIAMGYQIKGTDPLSRQNYMNIVNAAAGVKGYEQYATPDIRAGSITWENQARLLQLTTQATDPNISTAASSLQKDLKDIPDAGGKAVIALDEWKKKYKTDNKGRDPNGQEIDDARKQIKKWVMDPILDTALSEFDYKSKGNAAFLLGQDSPYQNLAKAMTAAQAGELDDVAPSDSKARSTIAKLQTLAIKDFDYNVFSKMTRGVSVDPRKSRLTKAIPIIATTDGLYWRPFFDSKQGRVMWQFATHPDDPKNWQEHQ